MYVIKYLLLAPLFLMGFKWLSFFRNKKHLNIKNMELFSQSTTYNYLQVMTDDTTKWTF